MKLPSQKGPALLGALGGAVIIVIVGFSWFGWVTSSTAEKLAKDHTNAALVIALTPICVDRFKEHADAAKNLEALKKISYFRAQGSFVENGGWATFTGSDQPNTEVARACADALKNLKHDDEDSRPLAMK